MKVLSLSLDPLILNPQSVVASRIVRYGEVVERYTVIVPTLQKATVALSTNTKVYATGGSNKLIRLWRMWIIATRIASSGDCDVITSQDTYFLGLVGYLVSLRYRCGFEVQVLGIEKLSFVRKLLSQFVLSHAHSIRVLSLGLKKRLVSEFKIAEDRMMLVPIYVDVSSLGFSPDNLTPELQSNLTDSVLSFKELYGGRFNIVSVNRLVPIKNVPMQLDAIAVLKEKFPQILLHIIGDGPLQEELQRSINEQLLGDHIILHGFKSGVALSPFFTQSDCFVLTSDFEGYGMVVIEAATAGLPIVMTDVGCAGEVIINLQSGLIVASKNTNAFTDAVQRMIEDSLFRMSMARGAQASIALLPSFDTVLGKYKASWAQALTNR